MAWYRKSTILWKLGTCIDECYCPSDEDRYRIRDEAQKATDKVRELDPLWERSRINEDPQYPEDLLPLLRDTSQLSCESCSEVDVVDPAHSPEEDAEIMDLPPTFPYHGKMDTPPDNAAAWKQKGNALNEQGKHDEAIKAFEGAIKVYDEAIRLNPKDAIAWNNKGEVLRFQDKYDEAIKCFDEAIKINYRYAAALNNKGNALDDQGNHDMAIDAYDGAIWLDFYYAEAWNNKGTALIHYGEYDDAIEAYDEAITINPYYAVAWYNKGKILKALGRTSEADVAFAKGKELGFTGNFATINESNEVYWYNKGEELLNASRYNESIEAFNKAIAINPIDVTAWLNTEYATDADDRPLPGRFYYDNKVAGSLSNGGTYRKSFVTLVDFRFMSKILTSLCGNRSDPESEHDVEQLISLLEKDYIELVVDVYNWDDPTFTDKLKAFKLVKAGVDPGLGYYRCRALPIYGSEQ